MRLLYVVLIHLVLPFVMAVDAWRALARPEHRGRLRQRLGFVPVQPPGAIWVHAVSVGEVQAAAALVRALQTQEPGARIVLSTVTPTGAQRARELFRDTVSHCYLPYDVPGAVDRFLTRVAPRVAVILETEIWPTLYRGLARRGIPLVIASARLSERSVRRYRRLASFVAGTLAQGVTIGAQSAVDAERFRSIGAPAERVQVTGNVKYDLQIPQATRDAGQAFRAQAAASRPVWIAGSTHEGEEQAALEAHALLRAHHPGALLILVPRHPQRFDAVRALLGRRGTPYVQRSSGVLPDAGHEVFLVDTLGELQMFYAAADVAFVGGSLVPIGGHNLLEPAVLGLPVLSGPHTENAPDVARLLADCEALSIVADAAALAAGLQACFDDPASARARGARGRDAVAQSRGAVDRVVAMVRPLLSPPASSPARE